MGTMPKIKTHDNGVQTYGEFCGLECRLLGFYPDGDFCCQLEDYDNPMLYDPTTNQIKRCAECVKENGE